MVSWVRAIALIGTIVPLLSSAGLVQASSSRFPVYRAELSQVSSIKPLARPDRVVAETLVQVAASNSAFQRWVDGFRGRAVAQGISGQVFDRAFRGVDYNTDVIKKDRNQSEYTKQIWDYLDSAASPTRIKNGKSALREHSRVLNAIEAKYGVDKEVVAAVWGLESAYGEFKGDIPTIEALATLAYDGRRGKFFEGQLVDALRILQAGDVSAKGMTGSWAGAMGHTQFIPSSYLAYAVDFTGDGKRDIWSKNPADALASTAAYLARFGWVKGQPWGVEVRLPRGFNYGLANRKIKKMPSDWASLGVRDVSGSAVPNYGSASILLPAGSSGAAFMIFKNFSVIERYNVADAYVIGVGHLSDRLKGRPAIQANWPRGYKPLSFNEKKEMQRRLTRLGFLDDKVDGIIGPNTINAIRAFQAKKGVTPDGYPSEELLKLLKGR
ncbi:lytic murein transglycosylase [Actibacterium lipolyticum]|uniref:Membrane-bound lytic murein transglycosylase B n=1 Tax=Actibacterium lipolyticum TaxID=1524263 RepID=A0A238KVA9_9RHOB|nr:lytic murein transglycosylase [Actibacterium lipolyticum]SMX46628.1 Membrane-bound lytic murein transglycosylase B precursor [Actibacterium lipolyticum]